MLANIVENIEISPGYFRLTLQVPAFSMNALPGQFVMLKMSESHDPLLRRPMGIYKTSNTDDAFCLEILYQVVGKGTSIMSEKVKGEHIDLLGPFGNGFKIQTVIKEAVFVAGGVGIAPLVMVAEKMARETPGLKIYLFIGGKSKKDILCIEDFKNMDTEIYVTTEDGSLGSSGLVTDPLKEFINNKSGDQTSLFACGPYRMLKSVSNIAINKNVPCQVSLDRRMACGFGVCLGCVIKVNSENSNPYKNVCTDGPVFDAKEVAW